MQTICLRLKQARMSNGFKSRLEFARYAGVEEGTYRHHENGSRGLTVHALKKYAAALNVCICWLITGLGSPLGKSHEHKLKSGNAAKTEDKKILITTEFLSLNLKEKKETLKALAGFVHK